jgi:hypothetical protein
MADPIPTPPSFWDKLPKPNPVFVSWFFRSLIVAVIAWLAGRPQPKPEVPDFPIFVKAEVAKQLAAAGIEHDAAAVAEQAPPKFTQGWLRNDDAVKAVRATLAFKTFSDTEAGKETDVFGIPEEVFLWNAQKTVTGDLLPAYNQGSVGSCVSFGTAYACETSLCTSIFTWDRATRGPPPEFRTFAREVIYGGSRVQIGKGRISGDGSVGAWAAKFVSKGEGWGNLPRDVYENGKYDLRKYSESTCRAFGRTGVPKELLPLCKDYPVENVTQVMTAAEARKALANGYGIAVCSGQGFAMARDKDGFCRAQGSWAHCMAIDGYRSDRRGFHIRNSWGADAHTGPVGKGDPSTAGFWADEAVVEKMLREGDSWAFSGVGGFKKRDPDWFIDHRNEVVRPLQFNPIARQKKESHHALGI